MDEGPMDRDRATAKLLCLNSLEGEGSTMKKCNSAVLTSALGLAAARSRRRQPRRGRPRCGQALERCQGRPGTRPKSGKTMKLDATQAAP